MGKSKIVQIFQNKYLTAQFENDEIIFAITVEDVQFFAKQKMGRLLDYSEMYSVKKGVEWGLDYWDYVIKEAISNLPKSEDEGNIKDQEDNNEKLK